MWFEIWNKVTSVEKHEKKQHGEKDEVGNKEFEFEMDGLNDMHDLDKLDDNDEEFQKFLNSTDLTDEDRLVYRNVQFLLIKRSERPNKMFKLIAIVDKYSLF